MKAVIFKGIGEKLSVEVMKDPIPTDTEVLIELKSSALNHRDVWMTKGKYPGLRENVILGSDGAGLANGQPVLINPNINWGSDAKVFGPDYQILGMPVNGTFAEKICVARDRIHTKPPHLSFEEAAALPLAGMTAYRALIKKGLPQSNEKILISGIGGGVALMACQFALALGIKVFVTSSSDSKIEKAISLGATAGVNYKDENWHKELLAITGGVDVVLDSAGGKDFHRLIEICNPSGRIVLYGGTKGRFDRVSPQYIFWKQLEIKGSTMSNDKEFGEMLKFVNRFKIVPIVDSI